LLKPEQPGNVMARLVVGGEKGLSGKFLTWVNRWKRKEMWLMDHSWNGKELEKYQD
jgi:hypothetical protein